MISVFAWKPQCSYNQTVLPLRTPEGRPYLGLNGFIFPIRETVKKWPGEGMGGDDWVGDYGMEARTCLASRRDDKLNLVVINRLSCFDCLTRCSSREKDRSKQRMGMPNMTAWKGECWAEEKLVQLRPRKRQPPFLG